MDETIGRQCNKCGMTFSLDDFYTFKSKGDGRLMHSTTCKECYKRRVRENRASRREQYSAYSKLKAQRPEEKARAIEQQRRYRAANPAKYTRLGRNLAMPFEMAE